MNKVVYSEKTNTNYIILNKVEKEIASEYYNKLLKSLDFEKTAIISNLIELNTYSRISEEQYNKIFSK